MTVQQALTHLSQRRASERRWYPFSSVDKAAVEIVRQHLLDQALKSR